jgi:hypothetical protein
MRKGAGDVKENEVALTACIRVMQGYGWSLARVVERIAKIDRRIAAVEDLRVSVLVGKAGFRHKIVPNGNNLKGNLGLSVKIGGEKRRVEVLNNGAPFTKLLRIPVFATDDGKVVEFDGASVWTREEKTKSGGRKVVCPLEPRRLEVLDAHRAVVKIGNSFEALKLMKRVELRSEYSPPQEQTADNAARQEQTKLLLRRYSTEKLPVSEYLANSVGALMQLRTKFAQRFVEKSDPVCIQERLKNHSDDDEGPLLRSPRLLACEALQQVDEEVFAALPRHLQLSVARLASERNLSERERRRVGVVGFLVEGELKAWKET